MVHIVLFEPRIPPNTGNIGRLCVVAGCQLHLIEPLGFSLDEKHLRRAGLDYWHQLPLRCHSNVEEFLTYVRQCRGVLCGMTTKAQRLYTHIPSERDPLFVVFGSEDSGMSEQLHQACGEDRYRLPMGVSPHCRSLNLSNSVSIVVYDILRRRNFPGLV